MNILSTEICSYTVLFCFLYFSAMSSYLYIVKYELPLVIKELAGASGDPK